MHCSVCEYETKPRFWVTSYFLTTTNQNEKDRANLSDEATEMIRSICAKENENKNARINIQWRMFNKLKQFTLVNVCKTQRFVLTLSEGLSEIAIAQVFENQRTCSGSCQTLPSDSLTANRKSLPKKRYGRIIRDKP